MYDVDRDGFISLSDLETIVKHLVGSSLNEEQVAELITRAMGELSAKREQQQKKKDRRGSSGNGGGVSGGGITFVEFQDILEGHSKLLTAKVPVGFD